MISAVMPVYRRSDITMVKGEGVYLFDNENNRYLDFATGIAVNALGHCHPHVVKALQDQVQTLWHCSNMYRTQGLEKLAKRLVDATFADTVFFCSSGTEAVETAVKITRKYFDAKRYRLITFEGGFHGRSMTGISAGGNEAARQGYAPLLSGFDRVAFNDLAAVEAAITSETAGILVEPIQGEGGIRVAHHTFLQGLRNLCDQHGLLLIFDEVQCGMGRSGTLFAFEQAGITPDIAVTAKGIGNGFPLAACLATEKAASHMTPGSHGSTYGANPLAMAVGNAVLDVMLEKEFLPHVHHMGASLKKALQEVARAFPHGIEEVRGAGLMLGIKTKAPNREIADALRTHGLLTAPAVNDNVIRILPPLIITQAHIEEAVAILHTVFQGKNA